MRQDRPGSVIGTVVAGALLVAATSGLAGCSGDDEEPEPEAGGSAAPEVTTDAEVAQVAGRLPRTDRQQVRDGVVAAVDSWIEGAYLGDYPRTDFADGFASFTDEAAKRARAERALMSNAAVGEKVDGVSAAKRLVRIDVLAPEGKVAGATARVRLVLDLTGDVERTDVVSGRLTLTPTGKGDDWEVFGWSLDRQEQQPDRPGKPDGPRKGKRS